MSNPASFTDEQWVPQGVVDADDDEATMVAPTSCNRSHSVPPITGQHDILSLSLSLPLPLSGSSYSSLCSVDSF